MSHVVTADTVPAALPDEVYVFPASFAQQRLFLLDQVLPGLTAYNLPVPLRIKGKLDLHALEATLNEIVRRHETLRTSFGFENGEVVQYIARAARLKFQLIDLRTLPKADRESRAMRLAQEEVQQVFSLSRGPLFKASLYVLDGEDHLLVLNMHHIIADGWSHTVLLAELGPIYRAFAAGQPSPLPELPIQYADFAVWQRAHLQGSVLEDHLAYWKHRLTGAPFDFHLPTDHPRRDQQTRHGAVQTELLPLELTESLRSISQRQGVTPVMLYFTVFNILLRRYTGETDIVVGSPIANRTSLETEKLIGFFANSIVLRTRVAGERTFRDMLHAVRDALIADYAHQDLPFERLVEELQPERSMNQNPLFQVMFLMQRAFIRPPAIQGLTMSHVLVYRGAAPVDLSIHLVEKEEGIRCSLEYDTDVLEPATIARMMVHYRNLLQSVAGGPDCRVDDLIMLSRSEYHQMLHGWNQTTAEYPHHVIVSDLVEEQALRRPTKVAVRSGEDPVTYGELNHHANQVARWLRRQGVGSGKSVAVCMRRTPRAVITLLGIMKSGAAYVPLDPDYPTERLRFMLDDADVSLVLTETDVAPVLPRAKSRCICLEDIRREIDTEAGTRPDIQSNPDDLAYIIYTSGSTGQPKGVEITHRSLVNLLWSMRRDPGFEETDVLLSVTTLGFDIAGLELFLPLVTGGRVELLSREASADGERLIRAVERTRATVMQATPTTWWLMIQAGWKGKKGLKILCGGEAMPKELAGALTQCSDSVWNMYGPTETTIWSSIWKVESTDGPPLIGKPIANTRMYILNDRLAPVPVGVPGELYIGGHGVARGYHNQSHLTVEKFVPDPFAGGCMYRTGDLARWDADGRIECLGRSDTQVKLRGFRVELGEIESVIREDASIGQCVVVLGHDKIGNKRLIGYIVPSKGHDIDVGELRGRLKQKLAPYMIPSAFVLLEKMPLTSNGKIDRKSLPRADTDSIDINDSYTPPRDELELQLANLWEEILGVEPIGITSNFFDLGGHSLLAVRLFEQIERLTGKHLPLATLFQASTVEQLAAVLRDEGWRAHWTSLVPIKPGGSRPPFYGVHGVGGNIVEFSDLAKYLDPDQPFYGIQAQGLDGKSERHWSVEDMAEHYLKEIRELQPHGPYHLGGSSFGGLVAYEIAQRMRRSGEEVGLLALFDTNAPGYPKFLPNTTNFRRRLNRMLFRIDLHWSNFKVAGGTQRLEYVKTKFNRFYADQKKKIRKRYRRMRRKMEPLFLPKSIRSVQESGHTAMRRYMPSPYEGTTTLFRASVQKYGILPDATNGWRDLAIGGLHVVDVPGHHGAILREPRVRVLVEKLTHALEEAQERRKLKVHAEQR